MADAEQVPFLGELPLIQSLRESGDVGRPAVLNETGPVKLAFDEIIANFEKSLEERMKQAPTKAVDVNMEYPK